MKIDHSPALPRVVSLHLHPAIAGAPLHAVEMIELVEGKGILNEPRYFGRLSRRTGGPSRRQVSLIEREQISEHAAALGLQTIAPGAVRANIETLGIKLVELVGKEIEIGDAVLFLYEPRDPCSKMDTICTGLRELMMNARQGVMAEVRRGGMVRVGDKIRVVEASKRKRV
jgi:MOSC domain-containing protein YiiM